MGFSWPRFVVPSGVRLTMICTDRINLGIRSVDMLMEEMKNRPTKPQELILDTQRQIGNLVRRIA